MLSSAKLTSFTTDKVNQIQKSTFFFLTDGAGDPTNWNNLCVLVMRWGGDVKLKELLEFKPETFC